MTPSLPKRLRPYVWGGAFLLLSATSALAEEGARGHSEVVFLAQLVVLMVSGRLLGEAMQRIGQPSVMGQLMAGILLGPSVLGWLWPEVHDWIFPGTKEQRVMLEAISQFGILLLLLLTGMETDLKLVRRVGRAAISISSAGVIVPFACGVTLGWLMPEDLLPEPDKRLLTALFLGTALSISSIKIVAAVVREMKFTRRDLGQIIVSSAIMEDTIGWIIVAITLSLAQAGSIDFASVGKSLAGTAVFLALSFTVGQRLVFYVIRWTNDHFESDFPVLTAILVIMGAMALTTHFIGVHTVLGAFISGVLIGQSPILTRQIDAQLRGLILGFFMPVFFGVAGLSADLTVLKDPELALMALGLIVIASIGKFSGAFVGGEIGGLTRREAFALGCAMNARGSTEVVIATVGLSMGALTQNLFTIIVAMAIVTTMAMPPMLRWALRRVPLRKAEKERLEREEFEAKGFVPNMERLLLAVDGSANGRFASRLAGLLAGSRGMPTTVLRLAANGKGNGNGKTKSNDKKAEEKSADAEAAAKTAAKQMIKAALEDSDKARPKKEDKPAAADVTVRHERGEATVEKEVRKGYDLLFVGIEKIRAPNGGSHPELIRVTADFDGPLAIVAAKGVHLEEPEQGPLRILVPVNGTDVSRRAAELAIAIARVVDAPLTALYVSNRAPGERPSRGARRREQAVLKDIVELADQYDQEIETAVRANAAPDEAILAEAKRAGHSLIVMGVNRRPSESAFLGDTATAVFEKSPASMLFVSA